jgi:hypothetical protein
VDAGKAACRQESGEETEKQDGRKSGTAGKPCRQGKPDGRESRMRKSKEKQKQPGSEAMRSE